MLKRMTSPLSIALVACLVVAGLCGILALYGQLSRVSELDVLQSFRQAVGQTALNLDDRMASMESTLRMLLYDARMQATLLRSEEEETLETQLKEIKELREMIYPVGKEPDVAQVRVYLRDEKMITREGVNFFSHTAARETPEYARVLSQKGSLVWMGAHEVRTKYFDDTCITLGSLYRSYFAADSSNWAVVLIDLHTDFFGSILGTLGLPDENARVVVTDRDAGIMYGDGDPALIAALLASDATWGFCTDADNAELAYITQPLSAAGWQLTAYMPRDSLLNSRQALRQTLTILLFGLTLLMIAAIGCIICVLYAYKVRAYIRATSKSLQHGGGECIPASSGAFFDLDRNISELLDMNRQLTEENYRAQLREREVTLQALQAQINPHFLYNTLDSINWMAIREGADSVSDAIATLAEYFRLSLSQGRSVVSLQEDIEIARKYLSLYQHRYDYACHVAWEVPEELLPHPIPKLTLQPLIENASQHGIFKRAEKTGGLIWVRGSLRDGVLTVVVADNGPGLREGADPPRGYGLANVRERLDLFFGGQYTMRIGNASEGGAEVVIQMWGNGISDAP